VNRTGNQLFAGARLAGDQDRRFGRRDFRYHRQDAAEQRRYAESLKTLVALRAPVDEFFERVMVMDENIERRNNRLALLRDVLLLLGGVADLSRLPG